MQLPVMPRRARSGVIEVRRGREKLPTRYSDDVVGKMATRDGQSGFNTNRWGPGNRQEYGLGAVRATGGTQGAAVRVALEEDLAKIAVAYVHAREMFGVCRAAAYNALTPVARTATRRHLLMRKLAGREPEGVSVRAAAAVGPEDHRWVERDRGPGPGAVRGGYPHLISKCQWRSCPVGRVRRHPAGAGRGGDGCLDVVSAPVRVGLATAGAGGAPSRPSLRTGAPASRPAGCRRQRVGGGVPASGGGSPSGPGGRVVGHNRPPGVPVPVGTPARSAGADRGGVVRRAAAGACSTEERPGAARLPEPATR